MHNSGVLVQNYPFRFCAGRSSLPEIDDSGLKWCASWSREWFTAAGFMSDSINWSIWLPVIASVSGVSAICSVAIVVYCYCRIRDNLTPVTYTGGGDYMREPDIARPQNDINTFSGVFGDSHNDAGNVSGFDSAVQRSSTSRVKFQDGENGAGVSTRTGAGSRFSRGEMALRVTDRGQSIRMLTNASEPSTHHHDNRIVEQDDGSQDVFV